VPDIASGDGGDGGNGPIELKTFSMLVYAINAIESRGNLFVSTLSHVQTTHARIRRVVTETEVRVQVSPATGVLLSNTALAFSRNRSRSQLFESDL
jgi:hypothetical protein